MRALLVSLIRWGVPLGVLVVAIVAVASELASAPYATPPATGAYAATILASAALLVRRRWPIVTAAAILIVCLAYHLVGYPGQGPAFALFVIVFTIPACMGLRRALTATVGVAVLWSIIPALPPHPTSWLDSAVLGPAFGLVVIAIISAVVASSARQAAAEHAARTADARASVARDIHDVLAHTIAAITVQSNLAIDAADDDPDVAKAAMTRVRDLARAATPQLRHSLLQLRDDGGPAAPQPTLELVDRVLDDARAAGFDVHATLDVARLDAVVELTIARIVQEAITNAVRHSGGQRLDCSIRVEGDAVAVDVLDDGARPLGAEGLGISGMRERAAAIGGSVRVSVTPDGHRVSARLPITSREAGS